jgi:hypothetical protein
MLSLKTKGLRMITAILLPFLVISIYIIIFLHSRNFMAFWFVFFIDSFLGIIFVYKDFKNHIFSYVIYLVCMWFFLFLYSVFFQYALGIPFRID